MLSHRDLLDSDIEIISRFPGSAWELFFMYPAATFPFTPEQLRESARSREGSTVILYNGEIAGYANFFKCVHGDMCDLGNVIVNPQLRRKGVGSYLINTMTQKARREHGAKRIQASCFNANTPGLLTYLALGFSPVDMEVRKDPQGGNAMLIHLEKTL